MGNTTKLEDRPQPYLVRLVKEKNALIKGLRNDVSNKNIQIRRLETKSRTVDRHKENTAHWRKRYYKSCSPKFKGLDMSQYPDTNGYYVNSVDAVSGKALLKPCKIIDYENPFVFVIPASHTNGDAVPLPKNIVYLDDQVQIDESKARKTSKLIEGALSITCNQIEVLKTKSREKVDA